MRRLPRRLTWLLACVAGLVLVAAVAIGVALLVTPMQTVTVAGQVIKVGTTSPRLSLSGPGEVDLFGQSLPTVVRFTGPVRPRLALTQITIDSELANFAQGSSPRQRHPPAGLPPERRLDPLLRLGSGHRRADRADPDRGRRGLAQAASQARRRGCWWPAWSSRS